MLVSVDDADDCQNQSKFGAFISEADDMGPVGSKSQSYLTMTDDHSYYTPPPTTHNNVNSVYTSSPTAALAVSLPFLHLEPPLSEEDYNFALEASEGIADLFNDDLALLIRGSPV